ncbi:hypothetical protein M8J77_007507 [Diaphorina citri]|nr:hypothetical protein M8J77_007507 [Diaphorina citri]
MSSGDDETCRLLNPEIKLEGEASTCLPSTSSALGGDESDLNIFENKPGLAEDMKFLASMPELCDVTFLVGDTREPVCAVKAVLAARSRVFHKMLYSAPSPQRKKDPPPKENKLRLFLKRSSEPLLNLQNEAKQPQSNQHHTLIIEEFEPDVFRQLIEYIHTGCVTLQPRTLLGVMNAADYYGLDELRKACSGFVQCCINVDTVCALLASAERYIQYKCTKSLVQKADPTSVEPFKLSLNRRRSQQGRSMSVQSSTDPYGSNTTLSSTGSSDETHPRHSSN